MFLCRFLLQHIENGVECWLSAKERGEGGDRGGGGGGRGGGGGGGGGEGGVSLLV